MFVAAGPLRRAQRGISLSLALSRPDPLDRALGQRALRRVRGGSGLITEAWVRKNPHSPAAPRLFAQLLRRELRLLIRLLR